LHNQGSICFKVLITYITKFLAAEFVSLILPVEKKDMAYYPIEEGYNKDPYLKPSEVAQISGLSVLP
jgi:hypothetical protein